MKCKNIPPSELPPVKRIITLGDIHGDYRALLRILYKAQIINKKKNWIARDTHLVQLGDILDRGGRYNTFSDEKSESKILYLLFKLIKQSKKFNSGVHIIIGNHEIMNILGDFSYTTKLGMADFNNNRLAAFRPGGPMSQKIACNSNSIIKIGSWLFSHAGILPEIANKYTIKQINEKIRDFILGNTKIPEDNAIMNLFWHRKFGNKVRCSRVKAALEKYEVKYQVVGHTLQKNGINSVCDNSLFRIDVGLSNAFGANRKLEYLEIINDNLIFRRRI